MNTGFSTYCISSGCLIVIGFMLESHRMPAYKFATFYFLAGILGNLFSICVQSEPSVGNMTCIMALVSGLLASIIVNWKAMNGAGMLRIILIFMMVILFVVLLLLSVTNNVGFQWMGISLTGEAGGFMSGLCLGMILMPHALKQDTPFVKKVRLVGMICTAIYCAILIPVFFAVVEPY